MGQFSCPDFVSSFVVLLNNGKNEEVKTMKTSPAIVEPVEIGRLRSERSAKGCPLAWAKIDQPDEIVGRSGTSTRFIKQAGYRLIGCIGPLIVAVYLLLQLHHLPNSSLSYSLLSAIISVLFNFSSSALTKTS